MKNLVWFIIVPSKGMQTSQIIHNKDSTHYIGVSPDIGFHTDLSMTTSTQRNHIAH